MDQDTTTSGKGKVKRTAADNRALISSKNQTKRNKPHTGHRQWTDAEVESILQYMRDTVIRNEMLEKPTATAYYDRMMTSLKLQYCSCIQLKNKVRHMREKYTKAVEWRNATGAGVLESEGEQSVMSYIRKICPNWDLLDEIYGSKVSIEPPYVYETGIDEVDVNLDDRALVFNEDDVQELLQNSVDEDPVSPRMNLYGEKIEDEEISTIKKSLTRLPKSYQQRYTPKESLSALTEAQLKRAETMAEKVKVENQRLEFDNRWKIREYEWKELELNLKKEQMASDERLRVMQLEKEERIEKFKIEQEVKLQLDLAKLKSV